MKIYRIGTDLKGFYVDSNGLKTHSFTKIEKNTPNTAAVNFVKYQQQKNTQKFNFCNIIPFSLYELYGVPCGFLRLLVAPTTRPDLPKPFTGSALLCSPLPL